MQITSKIWKGKEIDFPLVQEECSPDDILISTHWVPIWTYDLQKCKDKILNCFATNLNNLLQQHKETNTLIIWFARLDG